MDRQYGKSGWSCVTDMEPIVEVAEGKIRGIKRNGNAVFRGIPYGDCCDGEYRFREPRPAKRWEGIRDCTKIAPIAVQNIFTIDMVPEVMKPTLKECFDFFVGGMPYSKEEEQISENCLVLNVASPGLDNRKRPVMVYIHGGGYMSGSGNVMIECSDKLLDEEDIVLVSINHRLNIFGGLYLGCFDEKYESSGLCSQLDLILALKWIKNNIQAFGGDNQNITLYGESGGGIKIEHLMAMHEAKGLYEKAIVISGSVPVCAKTKEEAEKETREVMNKLGIAECDWKDLLTMPATQLIQATAGANLVMEDRTPFMPTPDGKHLPFHVTQDYWASEVSKEVPLLVGSSEEEIASDVVKNPMMTWKDVREELLKQEFRIHQKLEGITEENVDSFIQVFRDSCEDSKEPWQIYAQMISMSHFLGRGAAKFAMKKANLGGAPVWLYSMNYDTIQPLLGGLRCAWHTVELPLSCRAVYYSEQEELSKTIAHAFASFARTGSPSNDSLVWPQYTLENKETMLFDKECICKNDPYKEVHKVVDLMCRNWREKV